METRQSKFTALLWLELRREWRRFLVIEAVTTAVALLAKYLSSPDTNPLDNLTSAWAYLSTSVAALALGAAVNLVFAFFSTWAIYVEGVLESFEQQVKEFQTIITTELAQKFALISDGFRRPTGLKKDALTTLSLYLQNADKLYSIVYVRPALWLNLGDLMNVFSLQAHYNHKRSKSRRPLRMVRFIVWEKEEFLSSEGIFVIRASMLVGAQTRIITRDKLQEVVRLHDKPALEAFVEEKLHVWLECRIVDGREKPQSGRYGRASEKGFEDPLPMKPGAPDEASAAGPANVPETEANFYELIELLNIHSAELDVGLVPTHVEEDFLRHKIKDVLNGMRTAPTLESLRGRDGWGPRNPLD